MKYLKLGMARDYYSVAYKRYRNNFLTENANIYMTVIILAIILIVVYNKLKKRGIIKPKRKKGGKQNA
jgi:hypothetical protein